MLQCFCARRESSDCQKIQIPVQPSLGAASDCVISEGKQKSQVKAEGLSIIAHVRVQLDVGFSFPADPASRPRDRANLSSPRRELLCERSG